MWFSILVILICFLVFERASNYLIEGLGAISQYFEISEAVLGASLAAMVSSAPEFGTSAFSVIEGHPDIGFGTIVGSAIFNVTVIIGAAAIIGKYAVERRVFYRDGLFYFFTVIVAILATLDGYLSRTEAILWSVLFFLYLAWLVYDAKKGKPVPKESLVSLSKRKALIYIFFSPVAIGIAARYLVIHIAKISAVFGISEVMISLVIVAVGTSIPDLFTSIQAARRRMGSLAVANALGSNIFDILACLGIPFSFRTTTKIKASADFSLIVLFLSVVLVLILMRYKWSISKKEGAILLSVYAVFLAIILV